MVVQTWRESSQLKTEALHSLAQSESDPDTLIAGTYTGIFARTTQASRGNNCQLRALPDCCTSNLWPSIRALPTRFTPARSIYLISRTTVEKRGDRSRKESSTIPTSSPSTSIRVTPITSLLPLAAASTKQRTPAETGARFRHLLAVAPYARYLAAPVRSGNRLRRHH